MSLDPQKSRRQREIEKAREAVPEELDPEFPYRRAYFSPSFFGLDRLPRGASEAPLSAASPL